MEKQKEEKKPFKKRKITSQKVLWGRVFDPEIVEQTGIRELMEIMEFQKWSHLFTLQSPKVYEDEVTSFYAGLFVVDEATLCLTVNGKDFFLDEDTLGDILEVPTYGIRTLEGAACSAFKMLIVKREDTVLGERVYKKEFKPEFQLLFEKLNKVLLPRAKRRSIASIADLVSYRGIGFFHFYQSSWAHDWEHAEGGML